MGRGVSFGGGQSSLGYLFGGGQTASKTRATTTQNSPPPVGAGEAAIANKTPPPQNVTAAASAPSPIDKQLAAGIHGKPTNNYFRSEGQNCGNFITDRPSTKVHSAPGGRSSLGYLFGGGGGN